MSNCTTWRTIQRQSDGDGEGLRIYRRLFDDYQRSVAKYCRNYGLGCTRRRPRSLSMTSSCE